MSLQAQVEYLAHRVERPIYYASSAGRNATHEIDQPMNLASVEVGDARTGLDENGGGEFGMHPCGFDLLEGREIPMEAGQMLIAPEGVAHGIRNDAEERLIVLAILAPSPG